MLIAQLTDTHAVDPSAAADLLVDNNGRLDRAVAAINAESPAPDLVIVTGDLTDNGRPEEFAQFVTAIAPLRVPVLAIPGNHDNRPGVRAALPHLPWANTEHASWVYDIDDLRVVGLDSTVPGHPGADIDVDRAEWLAEAIDGATGRCVLAIHHPPFITGIDWMDKAGFDGLDRLRGVLEEHPVERVLCGHHHRPIHSTIAGIPAIVGPSTVQHVDLDLAPAAPISLILDPVGYLIHSLTENSWVTHTRYFDTGAERIHPTWTTVR